MDLLTEEPEIDPDTLSDAEFWAWQRKGFEGPPVTAATEQALSAAEQTGDWSECMDAVGAEMAVADDWRQQPKQYRSRGRLMLKVDISNVAAKLEKIIELNRQFWRRMIDYGNECRQQTGRFPNENAFAAEGRKIRNASFNAEGALLPSDIAQGTRRAIYKKVFVKQMLHRRVSEFPPTAPSLHVDHIQLDMLANVIHLPCIGSLELLFDQTKVWPMKWKGREGKLKSSPLWRFLTDGKFDTRSGALLRGQDGIWYFLLSFKLNPNAIPQRDKGGVDPGAERIVGDVRELFEAADDDRLHVADIAAVLGLSAQSIGKALARFGIKGRIMIIDGKRERGYDRAAVEALLPPHSSFALSYANSKKVSK